MDREEIRSLKKEERSKINSVKRGNFNQAIQNKLLELLQPYQKVGIYLNLPNEVDTLSILPKLLEEKDVVASSKCFENNLQFYQIHKVSELSEGCFSILEPLEKTLVSKEELEVILVPLIAFDQNRNRLGFGKGYYDRYLTGFAGKTIGLAYECQKVDNIPIEPWDIPLDSIITEKEIY